MLGNFAAGLHQAPFGAIGQGDSMVLNGMFAHGPAVLLPPPANEADVGRAESFAVRQFMMANAVVGHSHPRGRSSTSSNMRYAPRAAFCRQCPSSTDGKGFYKCLNFLSPVTRKGRGRNIRGGISDAVVLGRSMIFSENRSPPTIKSEGGLFGIML
jgi:hypothetical protein